MKCTNHLVIVVGVALVVDLMVAVLEVMVWYMIVVEALVASVVYSQIKHCLHMEENQYTNQYEGCVGSNVKYSHLQ